MIKLSFSCSYCGHFWRESYWSIDSVRKECPICHEKKAIKIMKCKDYFGYEESEVVKLEDQLKFEDDLT